jgi:hypothetical protein
MLCTYVLYVCFVRMFCTYVLCVCFVHIAHKHRTCSPQLAQRNVVLGDRAYRALGSIIRLAVVNRCLCVWLIEISVSKVHK